MTKAKTGNRALSEGRLPEATREDCRARTARTTNAGSASGSCPTRADHASGSSRMRMSERSGYREGVSDARGAGPNCYGITSIFLSLQKKVDSLMNADGKEWIVYCKPPFKNAACVVEYLGRYTHRVAISNKRIVSMEKDTVSFKWRDYKDDSKNKMMTLSSEEFIRRFLIHILPRGFMKIRHYGLLGNRNKATKLKLCKQLTHTPLLIREKASTLQLIQKLTGLDLSKCPNCGSEKPRRFMILGKSPPTTVQIAYI